MVTELPSESSLVVPCPIPTRYWRKPGAGPASDLVLLLHGFQQTGAHLYRRLASAVPDGMEILAPNAPFLVPRRRKDGTLAEGYSWYFYNPETDEYVLGMEPAIASLRALVARVGGEGRRIRAVGFSQGGYLAPFLQAAGGSLAGTRQVVMLASRFLHEEVAAPRPYRLDGICGARDEIVPLEETRQSHKEFLAQGGTGEFITLPDTGHDLDAEMARNLSLLLRVDCPPARV